MDGKNGLEPGMTETMSVPARAQKRVIQGQTANITLLPLPPKCPELNPAENVWQFIRDNWLSNRIFKS